MKYENDFPMLNNDYIYFDNAATTFKPKEVIEKIKEYYEKYNCNIHRGSYDLSFRTSDKFEESRIAVQKFINAKSKNEIIFTSGTTDSLNMIINGFFSYYLKDNDEVLLSISEHASNVLPWINLSKRKKIFLKYIDLDENNKININNLLDKISSNTRVISLAYITNVIGDVRNIKEICKKARERNILVVVDGAQSVGHIITDVQDIDCDFFAFSAHKMYGPEGVGVLYGKDKYVQKMIPTTFGGGMNKMFNTNDLTLSYVPQRFEAGTLNIGNVIAFKSAINYIYNIGMNNINRKEYHLRLYLVSELSKIPYITIHNKFSEGPIILITAKNIESSNLGLYLNSKKICTRSGSHCAKLLKDDFSNTLRISLAFYNTYEEIDYLLDQLRNKKNLYNF